MRNPAWQPAHRDHPTLRQLREHYLPEAAAGQQETGGQTLHVPVITACIHSAEDTDYLIAALNRQLNLHHGQSSAPHRWRLDALRADDLEASPPPQFIVVVAEADLSALREAYARIKYVHRRHAVGFAVLIQGARDALAARRYYRRLAMAAMSFLDLDLLDLGSMPVRGQAFGAALARLAQCIRDGADGQRRDGVSPRDGS